jgi:hypothetical protein
VVFYLDKKKINYECFEIKKCRKIFEAERTELYSYVTGNLLMLGYTYRIMVAKKKYLENDHLEDQVINILVM